MESHSLDSLTSQLNQQFKKEDHFKGKLQKEGH